MRKGDHEIHWFLRIRTTPEVKTTVEKLAATEARSVAAQVGMILRQALATVGSSA